MRKSTFKRENIQQLLVALLMFSNANNDQGLTAICTTESLTFGEISEHLLNVLDEVDVDGPKSILSTLSKIKLN